VGTDSTVPDIPHLEVDSVLRRSQHSDLLLYRGLRNYRSIEVGRTYVVRVWDRTGLVDVERDRLVELLGGMVDHQRSPLLVRVHDVLVDGDGRLVVVQEHIPGGSFRRHYRTLGSPLEDVLTFGIRLTAALSILHRYMVHRRVGPSVVLFRSDPDDDRFLREPGLAGVEVAELADSAGWGPWRSRWASPAVRSGDRSGDQIDDLYAVAALMWSALTGDTPPFVPEQVPDSLRRDVPLSLVGLLQSAMEPGRLLLPLSADILLNRLLTIEHECGFPSTTVEEAGSMLTEPVHIGNPDDYRWSGFFGRPPRVDEPQPGPVPGPDRPRPGWRAAR